MAFLYPSLLWFPCWSTSMDHLDWKGMRKHVFLPLLIFIWKLWKSVENVDRFSPFGILELRIRTFTGLLGMWKILFSYEDRNNISVLCVESQIFSWCLLFSVIWVGLTLHVFQVFVSCLTQPTLPETVWVTNWTKEWGALTPSHHRE